MIITLIEYNGCPRIKSVLVKFRHDQLRSYYFEFRLNNNVHFIIVQNKDYHNSSIADDLYEAIACHIHLVHIRSRLRKILCDFFVFTLPFGFI